MVTVSSKFNPIYVDNDLLMSPEDMYSYADGKKRTVVGKIIKGLGSAAKWVGKELKLFKGFLVKEEKKIAKGVKEAKSKIKSKRKLKHFKRQGDDMDFAKSTTPTLGTSNSGLKTLKSDKVVKDLLENNKLKSDSMFIEPFPEVTQEQAAKLPPEKVIKDGDKLYDASKAEQNKEVAKVQDQNGNTIIGTQHSPDEVVGTKDENGNYVYYPKEEDTAMSTTTKVLIGVGAAAVLATLIYLAARKKK
jgi:hypothetical protein